MTVLRTQTQKVPSPPCRRARFRSFLSFLAQYSDVEVKTKKLFSAARVIHLTSEDAPESEESIALTTTGALLQMFEAWWLEFKQKDDHSGSLQTKLRLLFKSSAARVSLKPYESGDGLLSFDPPPMLLRRRMHGYQLLRSV